MKDIVILVLMLGIVFGGFYFESLNNELRTLVKHNDFNERMSVIEANISAHCQPWKAKLRLVILKILD